MTNEKKQKVLKITAILLAVLTILTVSSVNEHNRFDELKSTADMAKVKEYFLATDSTLSNFKIRNKFEDLLVKFVVSGGFDL